MHHAGDSVGLVGVEAGSAPLTGGLLVLRPSAKLFHDATLLLASGFSVERGWGSHNWLVGKPNRSRAWRGVNCSALREYCSASGSNFSRWSFFAVEADQGFFYALFSSRGSYRALSWHEADAHFPTVHYFGDQKPWRRLGRPNASLPSPSGKHVSESHDYFQQAWQSVSSLNFLRETECRNFLSPGPHRPLRPPKNRVKTARRIQRADGGGVRPTAKSRRKRPLWWKKAMRERVAEDKAHRQMKQEMGRIRKELEPHYEASRVLHGRNPRESEIPQRVLDMYHRYFLLKELLNESLASLH